MASSKSSFFSFKTLGLEGHADAEGNHARLRIVGNFRQVSHVTNRSEEFGVADTQTGLLTQRKPVELTGDTKIRIFNLILVEKVNRFGLCLTIIRILHGFFTNDITLDI